MTYYTLTPSGYVPADPQPVVVPEGYMVVKREPDEAMFKSGHMALDRAHFYLAMTQAGELKDSADLAPSAGMMCYVPYRHG